MISEFLKSSAIYSFAVFLSRGLAVLLLPIYTALLTPSEFGLFDLMVVVTSIINLTIALEITQGIARFLYEQEEDRERSEYTSSALWFTIICYLVFTCIFLINKDFISFAMGFHFDNNTLFYYFVIYIVTHGLFNFFQNQLRWEGLPYSYLFLLLSHSVFTLVLTFFVTRFFEVPLMGILLSIILGNVVGTVFGVMQTKHRIIFAISYSKLIEMLRFSAPLVLSSVAIWISLFVDRFMINKMLDISAVGIYGFNNRIAGYGALLLVGFSTAITPLIYKNAKNKSTPSHVGNIFRLYVILSLIILSFYHSFGTDISRFFGSSDFFASKYVLVMLVVGILISKLNVYAPGISLAKKSHLFIYLYFMGAGGNIGLNYILIPIFGISGAAFATVFSSVLVIAVLFGISQRYYKINYHLCSMTVVVTLTVFWLYVAGKIDFLQQRPLVVFVSIMFVLILLLFRLCTTDKFLKDLP